MKKRLERTKRDFVYREDINFYKCDFVENDIMKTSKLIEILNNSNAQYVAIYDSSFPTLSLETDEEIVLRIKREKEIEKNKRNNKIKLAKGIAKEYGFKFVKKNKKNK